MGAGSVVAVFVVENPLDADGPLAQHMVTPPLALSRPDDSYIRHLWSHSSVLDRGGLGSLRGRPAQEVVDLFRKFNIKINERADSGEPELMDLLLSCCRGVDQERRIQSHAQSRIPSVYWEDIGGLGHVRREVLDAIELPLRYPHLLPSGNECSRAGMLLWGPPGTGAYFARPHGKVSTLHAVELTRVFFVTCFLKNRQDLGCEGGRNGMQFTICKRPRSGAHGELRRRKRRKRPERLCERSAPGGTEPTARVRALL